MSGLLALKYSNNVFTARANVKHTTGGPVMALVGFIHPIADLLFQDLGEELTAQQKRFLAEKICFNEEKRVGFYPSFSSSEFYGHIFNRDGKLENWYSPNTYASRFSCLVRYYGEAEKKFVYKVFSPIELELA